MKLRQKGIILVSVPLIFQIGFIIWLMHLLNVADEQIDRLARSQVIIAEANSLTNSLVAAGSQVIMFKLTHRESLREKLDKTISEFPVALEKLSELAKGDPRREKHVEEMKESLLSCNDFITSYRKKIGIDTGPFDVVTLSNQARAAEKAVNSLLAQTKRFSAEEQALQSEYPGGAEGARRRVRLFLWVGIALNVLLSLCLALFFSKTITGRLAVLRENALLLASRRPLNAKLAGNDEINYLDQVFHNVAFELNNAEQRKQEFVSMISHDMRTPLTSLQGTLALFAAGTYGELSDRAMKRIHASEANIFRLVNLINQLLDMEKIEAGMMEMHTRDISLQPLIHQAIESARGFAEQNEITIEEPEVTEEILVRADEQRTTQVLINLISNAVKYSPPGKKIRLTASKSTQFAEIKVVDEGVGIPAQYTQKIFERFQRIDRGAEKHASSGLGLAICKAFVEAQGGQIGVTSAENKGSTFWFRLPLAQLESAETKLSTSNQAP